MPLSMTHEVDILAKTIWDYMLMHHTPKPMDAIFALGSNDTKVALRSAELYLQGYGSWVICAGGNGKDSRLLRPEAEIFSEIIINAGVPRDRVIIENTSVNTGENILFVKKLLQERGLHLNSFILVQKPYMERRTYATALKQWPEVEVLVTSPQISFGEYWRGEEHKKEGSIATMVGDLLRIREYPALGFQVEQDIPEDVWEAGQRLIRLGFDRYALS